MKKRNEKGSKKNKGFGASLLDGLLELVIMLVALAIGTFVLALFGVDFESCNADGDLIALIGILTVALLVAIGSLILRGIKWLINRRG